MPTFTATYTARGGQRRELRVSAADVASAKRDLRRRGIVPVSLVASDAKSGGAGAGGGPAGSKPSLLKMDLGSFFEAKPDLGTVQSEWLSVEADPSYIGQACVLLAEQQADGSFHVRAVIRNQTALKAAYAALYAKQKAAHDKALAEVAAANDADGALAQQA